MASGFTPPPRSPEPFAPLSLPAAPRSRISAFAFALRLRRSPPPLVRSKFAFALPAFALFASVSSLRSPRSAHRSLRSGRRRGARTAGDRSSVDEARETLGWKLLLHERF